MKILMFILFYFSICFNQFSQTCIVNHTSPDSGSVVYTLTPRMIWTIVNNTHCGSCNPYGPGTTYYYFKIATDQGMSNVIFQHSGPYVEYSITPPPNTLQNNTTYWWNVRFTRQLNCLGSPPCNSNSTCDVTSVPWSFTTSLYSGIESINEEIPESFRLDQNYPNPFNPVTKIRFQIPEPVFVYLVVSDVLGNIVSIIYKDNLKAGYYEAEFNGDSSPSGIYFCSLTAGSFRETKKMMLLK